MLPELAQAAGKTNEKKKHEKEEQEAKDDVRKAMASGTLA
jgi:hypothetical protein